MEQTNQIPFAYLHLLKKEGVSISDLDSETQSYIKDLKQTTQVLINRAKGGDIKVSAQTERKIKNYDRAICEGIYDYIDGKGNEPEAKPETSAKEEEQLKAIHEKQKGGEVKDEKPKSEGKGSLQDIDLSPNEPNQEDEQSSKTELEEKQDNSYKGFWNWK